MTYSDKCDKLAGFLTGALKMGYDYNDAWSLLLSSKEGQGILDGDYTYCVHQQGITSARKADAVNGAKYAKLNTTEPDVATMELLAEFIELAHQKFNVPYDNIFKKTTITDFMSNCGNVLGNYDDKLIKTYIL